ncbi:MAG TPA: carboxypeptidase regulatory-like domain-containing protein, partial [Kofleriaceae bacterium]|nr:carboxypeptidase regulatory-like domain-containing protein [Kofleriaceae bacterium]
MLGRVVIYRNGVAFYERRAKVVDGKLAIHVPRDRVDDFLKSLTVVDPTTRKPLSVSIPRKEADDGSYLTMTLETPDRKRADVLLTYVTEAPAWKPSYRIVVGDKGKVMLEGWAIVDNVSGEDWKGVLVGVGASSAMSFRYDLWSVRTIDRDLLQGEDKFAVAPPTGVSPYDEAGGEVLGALDNNEVRSDVKAVPTVSGTSIDNTYVVEGVNTSSTTTAAPTNGGTITGVLTDKKTGEKLAGATVVVTSPALQGEQVAISDEQGSYRINALPPGNYMVTFYYGDSTTQHPNVSVRDKQVAQVAQKLDQSQASKGEVIQITASAPMIEQSTMATGIVVDKDYIKSLPPPGRTFDSALGAAAGSTGDSYAAPPPPPPVRQGDQKLEAIAKQIAKTPKDIVIESRAVSLPEARQHAEAVRNKLIDDGVPAKRIKLDAQAGGTGLRLLAVAPGGAPGSKAPPSARVATSDTPVGESHFMADRPMDVRAGSSAMVAMVHDETDGGVVYLYDPISERGDRKFAFRAVKLTNPTTDTLEP